MIPNYLIYSVLSIYSGLFGPDIQEDSDAQCYKFQHHTASGVTTSERQEAQATAPGDERQFWGDSSGDIIF